MSDQQKTQTGPANTPRVARPGEYFFEMAKLDEIAGGPDYSSDAG